MKVKNVEKKIERLSAELEAEKLTLEDISYISFKLHYYLENTRERRAVLTSLYAIERKTQSTISNLEEEIQYLMEVSKNE